MKASIHQVFEIEQNQSKLKSQTKTIQSKTTSCEIGSVEMIKKSTKQVENFTFDFTPIKPDFIELARSSIEDTNKTDKIIPSVKIPFYLLYKQLKYSLYA